MYAPNFLDDYDRLVAFAAETHGQAHAKRRTHPHDADMIADALILLERQLKHGGREAPRTWSTE